MRTVYYIITHSLVIPKPLSPFTYYIFYYHSEKTCQITHTLQDYDSTGKQSLLQGLQFYVLG